MASKAGRATRSTKTAKAKREKLHRLVDDLPSREVEAALRYVAYLRSTIDPGIRTLVEAPYDDEPLTKEEEVALEEGLADIAAGRVIPHDEVKRRLLGTG
ncbi:MAG: hypothetical protein WD645_06400 [Dehalococcoidia bacterium]